MKKTEFDEIMAEYKAIIESAECAPPFMLSLQLLPGLSVTGQPYITNIRLHSVFAQEASEARRYLDSVEECGCGCCGKMNSVSAAWLESHIKRLRAMEATENAQ